MATTSKEGSRNANYPNLYSYYSAQTLLERNYPFSINRTAIPFARNIREHKILAKRKNHLAVYFVFKVGRETGTHFLVMALSTRS